MRRANNVSAKARKSGNTLAFPRLLLMPPVFLLAVLAGAMPALLPAAQARTNTPDTSPGNVDPAIGRKISPNSFRCEDFISGTVSKPNSRKKTADTSVVNLPWQETVDIETCDRIQRLSRLAMSTDETQAEFYIQRIPKEKLPPGFPDIPMLRVIFPQNVFFDTGKSTLRPEAEEIVNLIAGTLRNDVPDVTLFVAGHTDAIGSREYNQNLSIDRANNVAAQLLALDVGLAHVWRIGFGEDMPLRPNVDEASMGRNRRVEFLFAAKPEAIGQWLADMQLDGLCQGTSAEDTRQCKQTLALKPSYDVGEIAIQPAPTHAVTMTDRTRPIETANDNKGIAVRNRQGQTITVQATPKRTISIYPHSRTTSITLHH